MARRNKVGLGAILFHLIMTVITGGFWLVGLFIWFLIANSRSK